MNGLFGFTDSCLPLLLSPSSHHPHFDLCLSRHEIFRSIGPPRYCIRSVASILLYFSLQHGYIRLHFSERGRMEGCNTMVAWFLLRRRNVRFAVRAVAARLYKRALNATMLGTSPQVRIESTMMTRETS